ncbi:MAG: hypothetical protein ACT6U0_18355, partial [Shinella sp.]
MKNKTGLVALIVLAAATLLMVFFVLPNMNKDKPAETTVATLLDKPAEGGGETTTADGKQSRPATTETATSDEATTEGEKPAAGTVTATATQETAKAETTPTDPTTGWVVPAFDLLRVEPDGSTVIAGRGQPNTKLEIKNGETVVATADIGPSGDFAAVFDQPLAAGDYQLTLNTKDDKGVAKTSEEVATVSVPSNSGGELLAMVSKPGEASRLITVPETAEKAVGEAAQKSVEQVAGETASATGEAATNPEEKAAAATATDGQAAGTQTALATGEGTQPSGEVATADTAATAADSADAATKAQARVSAVELEGERMFIAGTAKPGALVRIYADDTLVGEAKADEAGRYVADGAINLSVGRHTVRADV